MKFARPLALALGLGLIAAASTVAFTEDEKPKPLSPAEMQGKVMALGAPCPAHQVLAKMVGTWTCEGKAITSMGDIPIGGEVIYTSIMGGKFLSVSYKNPNTPMGLMEGAGHMGYDRLAEEYVSTWVFSMSTSIETKAGTYDEKTKTITLMGKKKMLNKEVWSMRETLVFESDTKIVETHYMTPTATGKEVMSAVLTYTKKAAAPAKPTTGPAK